MFSFLLDSKLILDSTFFVILVEKFIFKDNIGYKNNYEGHPESKDPFVIKKKIDE
jgi:hypothetical protein